MAFKKGQSGNPRGRPPKVVENAQQSVLLRLFDESAEEAVVKAMIRKASLKGDVSAATWLWDRKYGKLTDKTEQTSDVVVRVEYVDYDESDNQTT